MYSKIIQSINSAVDACKELWKEPITKIISARNGELKKIKDAVSMDHCMPNDILPDAKSIICFFIPFHEAVVNGNINGTLASEKWAVTYIETNILIKKINENIEDLLEQDGYKAGKIAATHNFDVNKLMSDWSHRHIAYIAGIGTFGINNMLITKKGCCGRLGSIITNYEFSEYKNLNKRREKCLNKLNGSCGVCQKKCVANAYVNGRFDRFKCYDQCLKNGEYYKKLGTADVCGKCLVGLPCSTKEPC